MPERARLCALVQGPVGLCSVLDKLQAFGFADLLQRLDVARLAEKVDPDHGPGFGCNPFCYLLRADSESHFINIGKDRFCTAHNDS